MKAVWIQWRRIVMTGFLGCWVMTGGTGDAVAAISTNSIKFEFLETTPGTHAATAVFTTVQDTILNTGTLTIELTNNSTAAVHSATDILLGVFFNSDVSFLAGGTVVVASGSTTIGGSEVPGKGWQVKTGVSITKDQQTYNSGIAGAGYGVFGPNGNLAQDPVKLDGSDYGIAGSGAVNGNPSVKFPVYQNRLDFTLPYSGTFKMLTSDMIVFQYGTALNEPWFIGTDPIPGSPEPASMTLILIGAGVVVLRRLRRRQARALPEVGTLSGDG